MNTPTPYSYLHPRNSLTYGSVLAGLLALFLAAKASWNAAWSLITVSVFLDTFDGKFAGLFERSEDEKAFGVQFDSLADSVTFGLVPVACLYLMMDPGGSTFFLVMWSAAAFAYLTAGLTRLGVYNIHQSSGSFFTGMPIPVSALVLSTLALFTRSPFIFFVGVAACSAAMVSSLRIPRPREWKMLLFTGWVLAVFALHLARA